MEARLYFKVNFRIPEVYRAGDQTKNRHLNDQISELIGLKDEEKRRCISGLRCALYDRFISLDYVNSREAKDQFLFGMIGVKKSMSSL